MPGSKEEVKSESDRRRNRRIFSKARNDVSALQVSMLQQSMNTSVSIIQKSGGIRRLNADDKAMRDLKTFQRDKLIKILTQA